MRTKTRKFGLVLTALTLVALVFSVFGVVPAVADNDVPSSTMIFQTAGGHTLTDNGDGTYTGVLPMVDEQAESLGDNERGYDVYARNGASAWFGDDSGSVTWDEVVIGAVSSHDAFLPNPQWDPDTPDWYQYSIRFYVESGEQKWAVRNHPGSNSDADPWYDNGDGDTQDPCGVPMSGSMDWTNMYAEETDTGAYLTACGGTPEIPGGAASKGGGPACWDMDWSWGSEVVPLAFPGFDVAITDLGEEDYRVTLTPAQGPAGVSPPGPVVNEDTGESYGTIQAAIDAASAGDTINVAAGTYNENVTINKALTLLSASGKDVTTIKGDVALGGELGTVFVTNNTNGVQIGDVSQGFTIIGIDGPPAVEKAAVYFQSNHSNAIIKGNSIVANGDAGLQTEWGATISGFVISNNEFSGQTFTGTTPGGEGFGQQFSEPNVPRQLVTMGGGSGGGNTSNITFTDNHITGTAGGINANGNPQGNTLVTIDSVGSTITGNVFEGTTTRYGTSLRARGPNATISGNDFRSTGLTSTNGHLYLQNNALDSALVAANTFDKGVYVEDPNGGTIGLSIQGFVDAVPAGTTINVLAGTYDEPVNIENFTGLTINGANKTTVIVKSSSTLDWNVGGYGSSRQVAFRVVDSTDVVLQNMTMDFGSIRGVGGAGYSDWLAGVMYWNSTGEVSNNVFKNLSVVDDASGGYSEWCTYLRAPGYAHTARADVTVSNNTFIDTGRVGINIHDYVSATVSSNIFYKTTDDFGYAVELGSESIGTISGNTIYGYDTPALSDGSTSAGIYIENAFTYDVTTPFVKNVSVTNNEVYDCQWGFHVGNEHDGYAGDVDIVVALNNNNFHDNDDGAAVIADEDKEDGSSVSVNGGSNTLTNNGDYGYYIYTKGDGDITVDLSGETITGHDIGVYVEDTGSPSTSFYNVAINDSSISGNTTYGVNNTVTSLTLDARNNWWGTISWAGYDSVTGIKDMVSGNVDWEPWKDSTLITSYSKPTTAYANASNTVPPEEGTGGSSHTLGYDEYATIQDAINNVSGSTVNVAAGTYNETVELKDTTASNISIVGDDKATTFITGGICFATDYSGLRVQNFTITGNGYLNTETYEATVACKWSTHYAVTNLEFSNCVFDGEEYDDGKGGRCGIVIKRLGGVVKFEDNEFKNYRGWATLDVNDGSGGGPLAVTSYTFNNNNVHDNWGSCGLRGNSSDRTDTVTVTGNTFNNNGNSAADSWAALEINEADDVTVSDNTITNTQAGSWGEGEALQFWNIVTLNVHGNDITNNAQGIYIFSDGVGGTYCGGYGCPVPGGSISFNNISGNTDYGLKVDAAASSGPLDAENNWWGDASGPGPVGPGSGDEVSDNVDYNPWCSDDACSASTYYVPSGGSIQDAIDAANDGDTIVLEDGSYTGGVVVNKDLTFNFSGGTIGPGSPAFEIKGGTVTYNFNAPTDCTGAGADECFLIHGEDSAADVTINGNGNLTIQDWEDGIEIYDDTNGASVTVQGTTFIDNSAYGFNVRVGAEASLLGATDANSIWGSTAGVRVDAAMLLMENTAVNNNSVGVKLENDGLADLGDIAEGDDVSGLGTGSSTNGSSQGENDLSGNFQYAVQNDTAHIKAEANYWGGTGQTTVEGQVYHNPDDNSLGVVDYGPWYDNVFNIFYAPSTVYVDGGWSAGSSGGYVFGVQGFNTIQKAINSSVDGTTITVKDGTYTESVTVNRDVTLQSETGKANTTIVSTSPAIHVTWDGATIDGFTLDGPSTGPDTVTTNDVGVFIDNVSNVMVKNCDIKEFYTGVKMEGTDASHTTGNTVQSVTIFDSAWDSVAVAGGNGVDCAYSDDARVRFSEIYNTDGSGLDVWECDNFMLEHSTLHNIGTETQAGPCGTGNGIFIYGSKGAIIDDNTFYDISQAAVLMWAMVADGTVDNIVSNNVIHDVADRPCSGTDYGAIALVDGGDDIRVSGNLVYNSDDVPAIGVDGQGVDDPADYITIEYNELRDNAGGGIYFHENATNVAVNFNYIFRNSTDPYDPSTGYGVKTDGAGYSGIGADCNYWGSYTGPTHGDNPDGTGDQVVEGTAGDVGYDPWIGKSGGTCDPNVAAKLYLDPASTSILEDGSVQVEVWAELPDLPAGDEMYSYQFQLNFDASLLEVTSASFEASFFDPQSKAPGWQGDYDNTAGWVRFAASLVGEASGIENGSGVLAYVTFRAKDAGTATSDITLTEVELTEKDSDRITPEGSEWGQIEVLDTTIASGQVDLQGRANESGAVVSFSNASYPAFGASDTTDVDGNYSVRVPQATGWVIDIDMARYLDAQKSSVSLTSPSESVGTAELLGGDVAPAGPPVGNNYIGIGDISLICGVYDPFTPVDPNATAQDVNADGVVDISDLVLAAGNYDISGPTTW